MVFSKKSDICIILLLFVAFNLCSQDWIEWQEIFASDGEINDMFWFEEEYLCELIGKKYNE
jgi:hypothetical protein